MPIIASHFSSKEQEVLDLKRQAEEERRIQNDRITQLEQMVQAQMQHNLKIQSMLDSQLPRRVRFRSLLQRLSHHPQQGPNLSDRLQREPPAAPPPKTNFPPNPKVPTVFAPSLGRALDEDDEIEIVYHNPKYNPVKKEPGITGSSNASRPPGGAASNLSGGSRSSSPVPTQRYSPTDLGADDMDFYDIL